MNTASAAKNADGNCTAFAKSAGSSYPSEPISFAENAAIQYGRGGLISRGFPPSVGTVQLPLRHISRATTAMRVSGVSASGCPSSSGTR